MALCWPGLFLLLSLFSRHANAAIISLSSELKAFVPACAQDCFISFLDSNLPTSVCTSYPDLSCLCSSKSASGYTVGEGALQCLASEDSISGCTGADAKGAVIQAAYNMCNGQANALPNTHSQITATLVVQTSVAVIAPTTTPISNSASRTASSTAITTSVTKAASTFSTITTQTLISSSTTTSTTPSSTATAAIEIHVTNHSLNKAQIVGIAVASVGGGALAVGILILFGCLRRRKRHRDSDLIPFQMDPAYDCGFKMPTEVAKKQRGPGGTANGIAAKIAPPVPARIDTGLPNMFSRRSIKPDTIGLALSPHKNETLDRRRDSSLLPDKPTLTLQVPRTQPRKTGGALKFSQPIHSPSAIIRQSTATQFEEDDESPENVSAGHEDWGRSSTDRILNDDGNWGAVRPVAAEAAYAPKLVVSSSEWRPPNPAGKAAPAPNSEYDVQPLNINRSVGSFSRPLVVRTDPFPRGPLPAQLQIPAQTTRPITQSSSLYSAHTSQPPSAGPDSATARHSKSYKQSGPYDRQVSIGSLTSFESNDTVDIEPKTAGTDLSPVVESPASGKSPVTYPKIPGRMSRDYIRMVPPPSQPDFASVFSSQSQAKPWKVAEMNAQRERERIRREGQPQAPGRPQSQYVSYPKPRAPLPPTTPPNPPPPNPPRPSLQPNPSTSRSSSPFSQASNASSLLAKRRGEQKANALMLVNEEDKKRQMARWRVLGKSDKERAMSPHWRPQLAGGGNGVGNSGAYGAQVVERMDLPSTPGWVPKLTPTRKGDELFLSVA